MKKYFLIFMLLFFAGCDIQKSAVKSKSDVDMTSVKETKSLRSADSVSFRPGKTVYKDTTIYRITKNNTRLETVYDSNGNIRDINCYAAQIEELTRENMALKYSQKDKASEKTESANFDWFIYIVVGIVVIVLFGFFLLYLFIVSKSKVVDVVLSKLK